ERDYYPEGYVISYAEAGAAVAQYVSALSAAGYGHGHRIAILVGNQPEHLLFKLALNTLGISCVPVNPDYRPAEIAYLIEDSGVELAVVTKNRQALLEAGIAESGRTVPVVSLDAFSQLPTASTIPPESGPVHPETEAGLMYTSGTTGKPKGCRMGHEYEMVLGEWYASRGGLIHFEEGKERLFNPLPLFHVNAGIVSFFAMMLTGNCQIQPERFSRTTWWRDIRETEATCIHYLGVVIPVLMNEPPSPLDREHKVKFGAGAGVEPVLHQAFEERFGFPLVELWGMTEMCRILTDCHKPRQIHTRAIGRPQPGLEVRVVDEHDNDVPLGQQGEMLVRHSAETPRKGAFLGYLNKPEATAEAWQGGWFHTGDTVCQDETGMIYFVDRKKNIIRRSGENIAAAEIEGCIQEHEAVAQVTVLAIADEMRDEEVYACVVLRDGQTADQATAQSIFEHSYTRMAYYKTPGWLLFVDTLPVTGTQKVLKHKIFGDDEDPRQREGVYDFRTQKRRS
ncbi:MAG: AMP-binding protein, partial [Chloroflexota bacterium]